MAKATTPGRETYLLEDVFTTASARTTFVERDDTEMWESYVRDHSRPICLEGPYQAGKTSIVINLIRRVFPKGPIHIVCKSDTTLNSIVGTAFQRLRVRFPTETITVSATDESGEDKSTKEQSIPIEQSSSVLAEFAADAERPLFIDDAHKLEEQERKKLAGVVREWQTQETPTGYPKIIITGSDLVGKESLKEVFLDTAPDLAGRLATLRLLMMSRDELTRIITLGGQLLNVDFSKVEDDILELCFRPDQTSGRPRYAHDLCKHACVVAAVSKTMPATKLISENDFKRGRELWLKHITNHVERKFRAFFKRPRAGHEKNVYEETCSFVYQKGNTGVTLSALRDHLSSVYKILTEDFNVAVSAIVDPEDGLLRIDAISKRILFAEPLYYAYYTDCRGAGDKWAELEGREAINRFLEIMNEARH